MVEEADNSLLLRGMSVSVWACYSYFFEAAKRFGDVRSSGLFVALFSEYLEAAFLYLLATKPAISFGPLDVLGVWPWWMGSEGLVAYYVAARFELKW